jgi:class 3 adenylate cyclase
MFCDLVGSTALAAALDVEDWCDLLSAYLDAASEAVTQMGGHVTQKLGDGLMALFGHPIVQENDSERAVRSALAIQLALAELNRKNTGSGRPELVARIGVDSGAVVVDAAGEVFGDAPNIAARVPALAEPGAVLVTARVQRLDLDPLVLRLRKPDDAGLGICSTWLGFRSRKIWISFRRIWKSFIITCRCTSPARLPDASKAS